tara:strand:+ start:365 stop:604 length:240 start_codon:yes stop_codon:yes gene_type:complete
MDEERQIVDIWGCFKEYLDKKQVHAAAERYVDLLCDFGVNDQMFNEMLGVDDALDDAIYYYLDMEKSDLDDEDDMYGDE